MAHKQTWVKVNARVDEEIAGLVETLSLFPKLQTIESCQGYGSRAAWVCFIYGECWEDLTQFVCGYLGVRLAETVGDTASLSIHVSESGTIRGELSIRPGMIDATTSAIRQLARRFTC
jgi:hypothetical protein